MRAPCRRTSMEGRHFGRLEQLLLAPDRLSSSAARPSGNVGFTSGSSYPSTDIVCCALTRSYQVPLQHVCLLCFCMPASESRPCGFDQRPPRPDHLIHRSGLNWRRPSNAQTPLKTSLDLICTSLIWGQPPYRLSDLDLRLLEFKPGEPDIYLEGGCDYGRRHGFSAGITMWRPPAAPNMPRCSPLRCFIS